LIALTLLLNPSTSLSSTTGTLGFSPHAEGVHAPLFRVPALAMFVNCEINKIVTEKNVSLVTSSF
jgi:hypothetical protein